MSVFRNNKGDVSIESAIGAIIFFIAFYIFLTLYDPIMNNLLAPILDNADKVAYGATVKLILLIIPVIMAIMGILVIVRKMQGNSPPPMQYYQ